MNDWYEAEQRVERAQELSESRRWLEALEQIDSSGLNVFVHLLKRIRRQGDVVGSSRAKRATQHAVDHDGFFILPSTANRAAPVRLDDARLQQHDACSIVERQLIDEFAPDDRFAGGLVTRDQWVSLALHRDHIQLDGRCRNLKIERRGETGQDPLIGDLHRTIADELGSY
ncbi:MAG: hypothetical protein IID40_04870, partial [Planctomycetes bacterium]|nr:hypothetical protein [Planctomycetota bacterium]